ncbi:MAG: 3-deoxy-D-manno-octulosonic acid kinase [Gammaproteobacteria bacterium]|nr:MAG: 3-deoxy-D-manno-octulosonic acid kinase [Gammaproteobacteria bacterium]
MTTAKAITYETFHDGQRHWRCRTDALAWFEPSLFDSGHLVAGSTLTGKATAGRGSAFFIASADGPLVLRNYRRGGMVRYLVGRRYVHTGLERSRAFREFGLLLVLEALGLPVSTAVATEVRRYGCFNEASLITRRLPGATLAEYMLASSQRGLVRSSQSEVHDCLDDKALWQGVGRLVARFHRHGVCHADLNTHNIMLDPDTRLPDGLGHDIPSIALIDFDRGSLRGSTDIEDWPDKAPAWAARNLARLERSVRKVLGATDLSDDVGERVVAWLRRGWACVDEPARR